MTTDFDAYQILGVDPGAGRFEIDDAYRRTREAYTGDDKDSPLNAVEIAYRLLSNPDERRAYDERRAAGFPPSADAAVTALGAEVLPPPDGRAPWGVVDVLLGILVAIGVGILGSVPFVVASEAIADGDVNDDPTALGIQLAGSASLELAFVLAAWLLAVKKYHLTWEALGFRMPRRGSWWLGFALFAMAMAVIAIFALTLEVLNESPDTDLPEAAYTNAFPLAALLLLTVVCAPLMEEVFFRGFAFQGFSSRWGPVWGAIVSGVLFGSAHLLNPGGAYVFFPIAAIGIIFAWGAYYARSIIPVIIAHFLFNGIQMVGGIIEPPEDDPETTIYAAHLVYKLAESGASLLR